MSKHTPTPWEVSNQGYIRHGNGHPMALLKQTSPWREGAWDKDPDAIANAAFIVKAANAHDNLVKALTEIDTLATCTGVVDPRQHENMLSNIYRITRAALTNLAAE